MLQKFLNTKPLYYDEIDYSRMPRVYEIIKSHLSRAKIIHIIGTNGKGTTGRFLATALHSRGFKTAHYTSPHILKFNERIWLNGKNISDVQLEDSHKTLLSLLADTDATALSYFEYTTFLAMIAFTQCEYIVLEAGLGGERDATAVFDNFLTLVTSIDIDHEFFLGNTVSKIATTKLNAINNSAILAPQKYEEVYSVAKKISLQKSVKIYGFDDFIDKTDTLKIENISQKLSLVSFLRDNLSLAVSALNFLDIEYSEDDFKNSKLFGRLTEISENILVDVGHNVLAAKSILTALNGNKYVLIYNSYRDKNYEKIVKILKPIISHVEIIDIKDERVVKKELLQTVLTKLEIKCNTFKKISADEKYLVFGSFSVVEEFIKRQGFVINE